jgi:hypothetical protein
MRDDSVKSEVTNIRGDNLLAGSMLSWTVFMALRVRCPGSIEQSIAQRRPKPNQIGLKLANHPSSVLVARIRLSNLSYNIVGSGERFIIICLR